MIVDCISDLHGFKPKLPGGDILIVAGDCTAWHSWEEWDEYAEWLTAQPYDEIVQLGGNHDDKLQDDYQRALSRATRVIYLRDEDIEVLGVTIYGSPWTPSFMGQNFEAMAFTDLRGLMQKYWDKIPDDLDILVTHGPPMGILDTIPNKQRAGCAYLLEAVKRVKPKHHVFGHIHNCHGMSTNVDGIDFHNVACVDECYDLQKHGAKRIHITK